MVGGEGTFLLMLGGEGKSSLTDTNIVTVTAERQAGVLDRPSCLAALAALRRTKWFQVCNRRLLIRTC